MPHQTPNPHDAEEAMKPYLGRLHDAQENTQLRGPTKTIGIALALNAALDKALELLGVQR